MKKILLLMFLSSIVLSFPSVAQESKWEGGILYEIPYTKNDTYLWRMGIIDKDVYEEQFPLNKYPRKINGRKFKIQCMHKQDHLIVLQQFPFGNHFILTDGAGFCTNEKCSPNHELKNRMSEGEFRSFVELAEKYCENTNKWKKIQ